MTQQTISPNQALWEKGDFTQIARAMRESGEAIVAELGLGPGVDVLDLGCGDGTTALPAARAGAQVLGVDIATNLVEAGNRRAAAAGLTNIHFQQGDACDLNELADDSFDVAISFFGAMFAPKPFEVAAELVRVIRPGGRIVMGNWIPGVPTFVAQMFKTCAAYTPPPPQGFVSPMSWGIESDVIERFTAAGVEVARISCEPRTYEFMHPANPSELHRVFRSYFGPMMSAYDAAAASGRAAQLEAELEALFVAHNVSDDPTHTHLQPTYLRVEVRV